MSKILEQKIQNHQAKISVVGLGYVGLPLAVNFAKKGYQVFGLDKNADRVNRLCRKENYILDIPEKDVNSVVTSGKLKASMDFSVIRESDAIIICVPTPLRGKYTPDISYIVNAVKEICRHLKRHSLVILESTTYPGTTEELIKPELEKSGLKAGKDFYLSFSPERIDPGNKNFQVTNIPKVIGGLTPESGRLTKLLYGKIIKNTHMVSSAKAAEMTKLLENTFRIINIGWANEVAMMCHKLDLDVWEIIDAAKTKPFGFMPFYPGLGVGGHCIPDDPLYLYWKAKQYGFSSKYIKLSADINSSMPAYAIMCLSQYLAKRKKSLADSKVLVIGATYKKDVKDLRKSPALKLIELLHDQKISVDYHDPYIPYLKIQKINMVSVEFKKSVISKYDAVLIAADHSCIDYKKLLEYSNFIYDIKNVYGDVTHRKVQKF